MRTPAVAGMFYEGDEASLRRQIEQCFLGPLGPGKLPKVQKGKRVIMGGVAPHAGYVYSGMVAAHLYGRIAEDGLPDAFIIIGPNHTGRGSGLAVSVQDYDAAVALGKTISSAVKGKDVVVIASTDMSHYVPKDLAKKKDWMALDAIRAMDAKRLYDVVREEE